MTPVYDAAYLAGRQAYIRQRRAGRAPEEIAEAAPLPEAVTARVDALVRGLIADLGEGHAAFRASLEEYAERSPLANSERRIELLTTMIEEMRGELDTLKEDEKMKGEDLTMRQRACAQLLEQLKQAQATLKKMSEFNPSKYRGFDQMTENASRYGSTSARKGR
ncbi:MAG: hypothetical protein NTX49_10155 [Chlamydiae bacterium]|nr:hypothetical protein [Chlamydiota bacterium]